MALQHPDIHLLDCSVKASAKLCSSQEAWRMSASSSADLEGTEVVGTVAAEAAAIEVAGTLVAAAAVEVVWTVDATAAAARGSEDCWRVSCPSTNSKFSLNLCSIWLSLSLLGLKFRRYWLLDKENLWVDEFWCLHCWFKWPDVMFARRLGGGLYLLIVVSVDVLGRSLNILPLMWLVKSRNRIPQGWILYYEANITTLYPQNIWEDWPV